MIVVADTTPINHLVLIGRIDILATMFDRVVIPPIVKLELMHPRTPAGVRAWIDSPPAWLLVDAGAGVVMPRGLEGLDAGEQAAIELALRFDAATVLMDERRGREAARRLGLRVLGTLGVLEHAYRSGVTRDLRADLQALSTTSFYVAEDLIAMMLRRNGLPPL